MPVQAERKAGAGGRRGDFSRVRRAYSRAPLLARARALTFDIDHPAVRELAASARAQLELWLKSLDRGQRGWYWLPSQTTLQKVLGALHTGVKLRFDAESGPIPVWDLSIRDWAERLAIAPASMHLVLKYLADAPITSPRSDQRPATVIGEGLGLIKLERTHAPMKVWFTGGRGGDQPDAIIALNGPLRISLSPKGLAALKLEPDRVEYQTKRLAAGRAVTAAGGSLSSGPLEPVAERVTDDAAKHLPYPARSPSQLKKSPAANRAGATRSGARLFSSFRDEVAADLARHSAPVLDEATLASLSRLGSDRASPAAVRAALAAENCAKSWIERAQRRLGRELEGAELEAFRSAVEDLALEHFYPPPSTG